MGKIIDMYNGTYISEESRKQSNSEPKMTIQQIGFNYTDMDISNDRGPSGEIFEEIPKTDKDEFYKKTMRSSIF